jgi:hypothetical protein
MFAILTLGGCTPTSRTPEVVGLPAQVYQPAPVYDGPTNSVGSLTEGYIHNTENLLIANSRLRTLCVAYEICENPSE